MEIKKQSKKLAELLHSSKDYNGSVYFDHDSYNDPSDIPNLIIDGEIISVDEFHIDESGNKIEIYNGDDKYSMDFRNIPEEWDDMYFDEINMFNLFMNVYYETSMSYEIGDYEMDFLGEE